jgi:hypothetical protein
MSYRPHRDQIAIWTGWPAFLHHSRRASLSTSRPTDDFIIKGQTISIFSLRYLFQLFFLFLRSTFFNQIREGGSRKKEESKVYPNRVDGFHSQFHSGLLLLLVICIFLGEWGRKIFWPTRCAWYVMNDSRSVLHAVLPSKSVGDCLRRLFFFSYPHLIRITFWIVWMSGRRYSNKRGGAFGYVCKGEKKINISEQNYQHTKKNQDDRHSNAVELFRCFTCLKFTRLQQHSEIPLACYRIHSWSGCHFFLVVGGSSSRRFGKQTTIFFFYFSPPQ